MKLALTAFLIISFVGVAVFGFLSMIYGDTHHGGCIASNRLGALCPFNGAFDFVVFHIDAFKYFSTAVFIFGLILLLVILSLIIFSILPRPLSNDEDDGFVLAAGGKLLLGFSKIGQITHWLSLHINSPAIIKTARV